MQPYTLTGFADEAGFTAEEQIEALASNEIFYMEARTIDGKNILDLSDDELAVIKKKLDTKNFRVSAIGSPIGKTLLADPFDNVLKKFDRAVCAAKILDAKFIRGFSFYIPKDAPHETFADEVVSRLLELSAVCKKNGLVYALENESGIFTDIPERCAYVLERVGSPSFGLAFDPANFINNNAEPFPEAFGLLKQYILYFHIKDGTVIDGVYHNRAAGEGSGQIAAMLKAAFDGGFKGFLSIEPHLAAGYRSIDPTIFQKKAETSAELFTLAANALKKVLKDIGM
ncbi:MAG: sugar phosphate isomerase/epimerase [Defluviitaleaceae bacterium]|nr:sugar phosphate isomerase/epimerase [Defluviitaleaceae bacterium]